MPTALRVIIGVLISFAAIILGYRIFRQHVVTAALVVGALWALRFVWKRRKNSMWRDIKVHGGEALLNRLQQNQSMVEAWKKKAEKVLDSLKELPENEPHSEDSPLDRSTLIEEKEAYLKSLDDLKQKLVEGHHQLTEILNTYRALTSGLKNAKSPKPGSREAEIRDIIKTLERKLTHFSNDVENLPMEGPSISSILKILSSLDF